MKSAREKKNRIKQKFWHERNMGADTWDRPEKADAQPSTLEMWV